MHLVALGVPEGTVHTWLKTARSGQLDIGEGSHTPQSAMSLSQELALLRKRVKEQDREIRRLQEEKEFLEEASAQTPGNFGVFSQPPVPDPKKLWVNPKKL